jgi:hypothetical protein
MAPVRRLAKIGVERSNRFTRSSFLQRNQASKCRDPPRLLRIPGPIDALLEKRGNHPAGQRAIHGT